MFEPIDLEVFQQRTGITRHEFDVPWQSVEKIVSLRDIVQVARLYAMEERYLGKLIRNACLEGDPTEKPYSKCEIRMERKDPHGLVIGQTFVERSKYQSLLESFSDKFNGFLVTKGVAKCTAYIVMGRVADGSFAIAHYIPPIIEENNGQDVVLDGIHRNFLVKSVGTTLETIVLSGVKIPFPCDLQTWAAIRIVDAKPPREERFVNLRREFFRDIKTTGIDG